MPKKLMLSKKVVDSLNRFAKSFQPRYRYKAKVDNIFSSLLADWCLLRYGVMTNKKSGIIGLRKQLYNDLIAIADFSLKTNDSVDRRRKIFDEIIFENDYLKEEFLRLTICAKFGEKNINVGTKECTETIQDCIKSIPSIIDLILLRDNDKIKEYTLNI